MNVRERKIEDVAVAPRSAGHAAAWPGPAGLVRAESARWVADQGAEAGQRLGPGAAIDPDAALVAIQQAAVVQHLEVMADGRPGLLERIRQAADAGLTPWMRGDQGCQPQPDGDRKSTR